MAAIEPKEAPLVETQTSHLLRAPTNKKPIPPEVEPPTPQADRGNPIPGKTTRKRAHAMTEKRKIALENARKKRREKYLKKKQKQAKQKDAGSLNKLGPRDIIKEPVENKEAIVPLEPSPPELKENQGQGQQSGEQITYSDQGFVSRDLEGIRIDLFGAMKEKRENNEIPTVEVDDQHTGSQAISPFTYTRDEAMRVFREIESTPTQANLSKKSITEAFAKYDAELTRQSLNEYVRAFGNRPPQNAPGQGLESYRANPYGGQPSFIRNVQGARTDIAVPSQYFSS